MMEEVLEVNMEKERLLQSSSSINQHPPRHKSKLKERVCTLEIKNLVVMSFSLFIFFLGFQALANLQSTMNATKGLGIDSQAVIYASSMISALLLPELLIKWLGSKKTLVYCVIFSVPYIASNFFPRWETLMPTAVFIGLAAGPLSTAQAMYTNEMSLRFHQRFPSESLEIVMARFYGVSSFFSENTQIWGNLISYYILRPKMVPLVNHTEMPCGINFMPHINASWNDSNPNLQPPTSDRRHLLVGIYVFCGLLSAILMAFFLDPLKNDIERQNEGEHKCQSVLRRMLAAVKQNCVPDQLLLLPLTIFCGMETAFYTSDFTQAFIACSWGVHHVGFVTICFGVCGALMAILVGPLVKLLSQMTVLLLAACANVTTCALLFLWQPTPDYPVSYFLFAGVWGMGDAIWWSQVTALYGLMFPNDREAAFSNFFFWSFFGYFLSYSYANYFTVAVKINILLGFLVVGIIGYLVGQMKIRCSRMKEYIVIEESQ